MLFYVLILFGLYGWIEFEALILIGNEIGGLASFLGIFVTAFIGMWLLRTQGRAVMARWQSNLHKGEMETNPWQAGYLYCWAGFDAAAWLCNRCNRDFVFCALVAVYYRNCAVIALISPAFRICLVRVSQADLPAQPKKVLIKGLSFPAPENAGWRYHRRRF